MPIVNFRKHLIASVSGGRSSAMMAILINRYRNRYKYRTVQYVFANTGLEHPSTIEFLSNLELHLKTPIIKLEFVNDGDTYNYRIVDKWEDLNMQGQPFKDAIAYAQTNKTHGLPHMMQPYCSGLMKKSVIRKYAKDSLGTIKYAQAIGYRAEDMPRRISWAEVKENAPAYIYPLLTHYDKAVDLRKLGKFWQRYPWRLRLPKELGNCVLCWKKSDKTISDALTHKHSSVSTNVNFWRDMEKTYKNTSFRGRRSIDDMINQHNAGFLNEANNGDSCTCSF